MSAPSPLYARQSAAVKQIQQAEKRQDHPLCDSKSLDDDLAQETQDFVSDQGKARLVIIGRNGTGKSTLINHVLLLSQVRQCHLERLLYWFRRLTTTRLVLHLSAYLCMIVH